MKKTEKTEKTLDKLTTEELKEMYLNFDWSNRANIFDAAFIAGELDNRGIDISERIENRKMIVTFVDKKKVA